MRHYLVEIVEKDTGTSVGKKHVIDKSKRSALRLTFEAIGIPKEARENYDAFVEIVEDF